MAAHIRTFLHQAIDLHAAGKMDVRQVELHVHGLEFARLGDQLDFEDWEALHNCTPDEFAAKAAVLLPKYEAKWNEVGQPATWEAWMEVLKERRGQS